MIKSISSNGRYHFSESEMSNAFNEYIHRKMNLPDLGSFKKVFSEVNCYQGRPDFIAFSKNNGGRYSKANSSIKALDIKVLSILRPKSPRTPQYIALKINRSLKTTEFILNRLKKEKYVKQTLTGSYILNSKLSPNNNEITVFELKLYKHKKAIFQAQQSRNYASRTIIIVPPGQEKNYKKFKNNLSRWGIGLAVFDPLSKTFNLVKRPRKSKPLSNYDYINTLLKISRP